MPLRRGKKTAPKINDNDSATVDSVETTEDVVASSGHSMAMPTMNNAALSLVG